MGSYSFDERILDLHGCCHRKVLQLVGGVWYERTKAPRRFLLTWNMVWRVCLMAVFLTVLLPTDAGGACAVLFLTVMCAAYQLCNPAQMSW